MLENFSNDFKTVILLKLTKSIIEQTDSYGLYELKKILTSEGVLKNKGKPLSDHEIKNRIKTEVKKKLNYSPSRKIEENDFFLQSPEKRNDEDKINIPIKRNLPMRRAPQNNFIIPRRTPMPRERNTQDNLPDYLRYLQPTRNTKKTYLDLGKLNPFLNDRNVSLIETEGPDEKVFVSGSMGKKPTNVTLNAEEINKIMDTFSKASKIPKKEGFFKVSINNMILTAMISDSVGSRFVIKKI